MTSEQGSSLEIYGTDSWISMNKSLHLLPLKSSMILRFKIRHGVLGDEQPYRPHQEATQSMKLKKFATGASASPSTKVLHG